MFTRAFWGQDGKGRRVVLLRPEGYHFTQGALHELAELELVDEVRLLSPVLLEVRPSAACMKKTGHLMELGSWLSDALGSYTRDLGSGGDNVEWYPGSTVAQQHVDLPDWVNAGQRA